MSHRTSFAMPAIVIGTYVCALYGAKEAPMNLKPAAPRAEARTTTTRPATTWPMPTAVTSASKGKTATPVAQLDTSGG